MRYVRFFAENSVHIGMMDNPEQIKELAGSFFSAPEVTGKLFELRHVQLLPPVVPGKIIAVGLNYVDHANELGHARPIEPVLFSKLPETVIGPEASVMIPRGAGRVDYEAELALVVGKAGKDIPVSEAASYIFGATCFNDVTERDIQKRDGQWFRAKNFPTFSPLGPWIVPGLDYDHLEISFYLNGKRRQHSSTSEFIWRTAELVSFISDSISLAPGDVIITGTPPGIGALHAGDIAEVVIEGIGTLRNTVRHISEVPGV